MNQTLTSIAAIIILSAPSGSAAEAPATQETKLLASDAGINDQFGFSTSLDGDNLVIGSRFDDDIGDDSGSVYVFSNNGTSWDEQQRLIASDAEAFAEFGAAVSVSGDTLIVGAPRTNASSGSGYVFLWDGINWIQHQKLVTSDGTSTNSLGFSVSISGETLAIGASEAVYIFVKDGPTWVEQQKLIAGDVTGNGFGLSVWINGDDIVVGAANDSDAGNQAGAAYVFVRGGATWSQQQKLIAGDAAENDLFGRSVSISADTIVAGARRDDDVGTDSGSAYVFVRSDTSWSEEEKLLASDGSAADWFGESVTVHGERIVVGAPRDDDAGTDSGAAYVFTRVGGAWMEQKLTASDAAAFDSFGDSVAAGVDLVVVGAIADSHSGISFAGSTYVYEFTPALPTATIVGPAVPSTYRHGDPEVLEWTTTGIDPTELMALAMKRDIVPPSQTEPDGIDWIRFTEDTPNDGEEVVTIPVSAAIATDWRFYVRHASSGVFDATDFTFSVVDAPIVEADLSVNLADSPDPVMVGGDLTYSVMAENLGPDDASGITLTHTILGSVTTFVSTNQPSICSELDRVVTCTIGDLASGLTYPSIEIVVTADEAGAIISAADVSGIEADPDPLNNTAQENTQVVDPAIADLAIVSSLDSFDPIVADSSIQYSIEVKNLGPDSALDAFVDVVLEPGLAVESSTNCFFEPSSPTRVFIGDMSSGESGTCIVTAAIDAAISGIINASFVAGSATVDDDHSNNSAFEETTVRPPAISVDVVDVQTQFAGVTSPDALIDGGSERHGVAADGLSRLLFRVSVPMVGQVSFELDTGSAPEDGGFSLVGQGARETELLVPTVEVESDFFGFAHYRAPDDFNRGGDEVLRTRPLSVIVNYESASGLTISSSVPLEIWRPPLVFIHGLWSGPATWSFPLIEDIRFVQNFSHVDYSGDNQAAGHFSTYTDAVVPALFQVFNHYREQEIAVTQVDVIGHSMGGLIARLYAQTGFYQRDANYQGGDFNSLVTLDTPHLGASLANHLLFLFTDCLSDLCWFAVEMANELGKPIILGAIEDLAEGSDALASIEFTPVPGHALSGRVTPEEVEGTPVEGLYKAVRIAGPFLGLENANDGLVDIDSQVGGIADSAASPRITGLDGVHLSLPSQGVPGNTGSAFYSQEIAELLNTPRASNRFGRFPAVANVGRRPLMTLGEGFSRGIESRVVLGSVSINGPPQGSTLVPGQVVEFTLVVDPELEADQAVIVGPGIFLRDENGTFQFFAEVPLERAGPWQVTAWAWNSETEVGASSESLSYIVQPNSELNGISLLSETLVLVVPGQPRQLHVLGEYSDGVIRDVGSSLLGTTYESSAPEVVSVDGEGELAVHFFGESFVTVTSGVFTSEIRIIVETMPFIFADGFESGDLGSWD